MIPWKLVIFLVLAVLLALFIGFNLENKCEVSFVFGKVESVPVYLTILISFAAGLIAALPFSFRRRKKTTAASAPVIEVPAKGEGQAETAPETEGGDLMAKAATVEKRRKRKKASDGRTARK